jgi:hypothetical protein
LRVGYPVADFCFLVALPPALDLLLFAKHLFVAAMLAVPFGTGTADRFDHSTNVE